MKENKNYVMYHGYKICEDGSIYSPRGKKLKRTKVYHKESHYTLKIDGKSQRRTASRLIYSMFADDNDPKKIIEYKDGNSKNIAFSNLVQVTRAEHSKNMGTNKKIKRFSDEVEDEIRLLYYGTKEVPQREPNVRIEGRVSYSFLQKRYKCCRSTIYNILRGVH